MKYWLFKFLFSIAKVLTITFGNVAFVGFVLTRKLTVAKRLGVSNLDKNKRFPFSVSF